MKFDRNIRCVAEMCKNNEASDVDYGYKMISKISGKKVLPCKNFKGDENHPLRGFCAFCDNYEEVNGNGLSN